MKNSKKAKKKLFDIFSQNLDWVKEYPKIQFKPDFSNGLLCPICYEVFFEKDLYDTEPNCLTLEHVPPLSLGGKPIALTCKNCNSKSGHELDGALLKTLLEDDFNSFLPNSSSEATFELNGYKVNGEVSVDSQGTLKIDVHTNRSHPEHAKQFRQNLFPPKTIYNPFFNPNQRLMSGFKSAEFTMQPRKISKQKRAEVALLRVAFLLAYATLGNSFLMSQTLLKVRRQILSPDEDVLSKAFWIKYKFSEEQEGIHIITLPKELRSFLVVFSLKTKSSLRRFGIVLPGPSDPGLSIYDFIDKNLCKENKLDFKFTTENMPKIDYLKTKDNAFATNQYWQTYTNDDYKPRYRE